MFVERFKFRFCVLTLQQIVLSKNTQYSDEAKAKVLTLQQIVLSKNDNEFLKNGMAVLTLQQIVLSKNPSGEF